MKLTIFQLTDVEGKRDLWKEYTENLFSDDSRPEPENNYSDLFGPLIQINEIKKAISEAKNHKSAGPDTIPVEILKLIDNDNIVLLRFNIWKNIRYGLPLQKLTEIHVVQMVID